MLKLLFMMVVVVIIAITANMRAGAASDPRVAQADHSLHLLSVLIQGVDECFNPAHADANSEAKRQLQSLVGVVENIKSGLESGNAGNLTTLAGQLESEVSALDESAPFPASLTCGSQRHCLELGFEGNAKYPRCQPVGGNIKANPQYLAFEELLDRALPSLISGLGSVRR